MTKWRLCADSRDGATLARDKEGADRVLLLQGYLLWLLTLK